MIELFDVTIWTSRGVYGRAAQRIYGGSAPPLAPGHVKGCGLHLHVPNFRLMKRRYKVISGVYIRAGDIRLAVFTNACDDYSAQYSCNYK
jgi:hypothetical protein